MISRHSSSNYKEDVVYPRLRYCELKCSQRCQWHIQACRRCSQANCQHFQPCCRHSQGCCWHSQLLPGAPRVHSGTLRCSQTYQNHLIVILAPFIRCSSCSEGQPEYTSKVWYFPENDTSKLTLHILSDTPGGSQWLSYILLIYVEKGANLQNFICKT